MTNILRAHRLGLLAVAAILGTLSGCGTGEYNKRMQETITGAAEQVERTADLHAGPTQVDALGFSINLPLFIDDKVVAHTGDREQPPFMKLPSLNFTYEVPVNDQPAFIYVAGVPADQDEEQLMNSLKQELEKSFSGANWENVTLTTPGGDSLRMKRLSVFGMQRFDDVETEGQFDLYLFDSSSHHVLLGWRVSTASDGELGLVSKAEKSMGSAK